MTNNAAQPADFITRADCPACGARGKEVFRRQFTDAAFRAALINFYGHVGALDYDSLIDATYSVARCPDCKSYFQSEIPGDRLLGRLYEEWIDPEMARARFHKDRPPFRSFLLAREVLLSLTHTRPGAPRTALDYGCGWGEWSLMTKGFGLESWATELSPTRRDNAAELGIRVVDEDDLPSHYFGLINLDQVLEHVPAPQECLKKMAGRLHPTGILRLAVPTPWRVGRALKNFDREIVRPGLGGLNAIAPLEHLNAFSQAGILRLAAGVGLERVRPAWPELVQATVLPAGVVPKIKAALLSFYLRSRFTNQLYFRHQSAQSSAGLK